MKRSSNATTSSSSKKAMRDYAPLLVRGMRCKTQEDLNRLRRLLDGISAGDKEHAAALKLIRYLAESKLDFARDGFESQLNACATQATKFEMSFLDLATEAGGYLADSHEATEWRKALYQEASCIEPECPNSVDSTLAVSFPDGSKARFCNPRGWVYPQDFHEER